MGKKCPEFENHERWLISYADKLTLLFAVFVVLYAIQSNEKKASKDDLNKVTGSMQDAFNVPLDDIPDAQRIGPNEMGFGIFEHFKGNNPRPPLLKKFPGSTEQHIKIIDDEMNQVKMRLEDRLYGPQKYPAGGKQTGFERIVSVHRDRDGFRLRLLAQHFFDSGSTKMRTKAQESFGRIVDVLKELGRPVTVEGHTDSMPAHGEMSNWEISALRATDCVRYMTNQKAFPSTLISAAGYADQRPIAHNGTEAGRALNRRIEIKVQYDADTAGTVQPEH